MILPRNTLYFLFLKVILVIRFVFESGGGIANVHDYSFEIFIYGEPARRGPQFVSGHVRIAHPHFQFVWIDVSERIAGQIISHCVGELL